MFSTHQKGEIGRLKVCIRAAELGYTVSVPTVEARYDLIIDDGKKLYRVQVKYADYTGTKVENSILIKFKTECRNNGYQKTYCPDEIDAIVVYTPKTDKCYWFGPEHFAGKKFLSLRFAPSKNGQVKRTRLASEFEW